jgi:hypothetical protein
MSKQPKPYKLKKRNDKGGVYYIIDKATGKSRSSQTADRDEADELAKIKYKLTGDTHHLHHLKAAEYHLAHINPMWANATWEDVFQRMIKGPKQRGGGSRRTTTIKMLESQWRQRWFDGLRGKRLIETTGDDFLVPLSEQGKAATVFARQLHHFAAGTKMLYAELVGKYQWKKFAAAKPISRAITEQEHQLLLKSFKVGLYALAYDSRRKHNGHQAHPDVSDEQWLAEWLGYIQLLWFTGASNMDGAKMTAENVKWEEGVLEFKRIKWSDPENHPSVRCAIGPELAKVLKGLPKQGPLFPTLGQMTTCNRGRYFTRHCKANKIENLTLHGYRYAFAERSKVFGMSLEDRMVSLGHSTVEMAERVYAKEAKVVPASIEVLDGGLKVA